MSAVSPAATEGAAVAVGAEGMRAKQRPDAVLSIGEPAIKRRAEREPQLDLPARAALEAPRSLPDNSPRDLRDPAAQTEKPSFIWQLPPAGGWDQADDRAVLSQLGAL